MNRPPAPFLVMLLGLAAARPVAARAAFPLLPGEAVATCGPVLNVPTGAFRVGVVDVRDPGCDPSARAR